jgi:hypothetical protein
MSDIEDYTTTRFLSFARDATANTKINTNVQRQKFTNLKKWISKKSIEKKPISESALGYLNDAFTSVDNIDDVEDDDVDYFMNNLKDFFSQIEESDLDTNESTPYEFDALLSPNLMKLLGKSAPSESKDVDWVAPSKPGLGNSSPIIKTKFNTADSKSDSKNTESKMDHKTIDISRVPPAYSESKSEFKDEPSTKDSGDKDNGDKEQSDTSSEYESEYGYDEGDGDDFSNLHVSNLSPNLMKALGMDTTGVEIATDWTPPETSGLHNDKLKSLTNFTTTADVRR